MRYSVFFKKAGKEKTCVYNTMSPDLMLALMNPKVHLAADSAGSFECSLNPNSPALSEEILERMATKVMVEEYKSHVPNEYVTGSDEEKAEHTANGEKILFYGRVLSISKDFYNTPSLYCEGAMSFLNDTVIMPYIMPKKNADQTYFTPAQALQKFLMEHNVAVGHQNPTCIKFETDISKMKVTMKDDLFSGEKTDGSGEELDNFKILTYTNTLEVLNNLKKTYGGHFRVRYRKPLPADRQYDPNHPEKYFGDQMAIPILDWIADFTNVENEGSLLPDSNTYIQFGKNLLDLTQKTDGSNIVNCVFLTGKKVASAESEVIGDEIDIAPMCYYWMVRDNGPDANGTLISSDRNSAENLDPSKGALNVHDLRFFTNVKEGSTYRNPRDLQELADIGDPDMSHVYHVGTHWYAYNPYNGDIHSQSAYVDIKESKEQEIVRVNSDEFPYGSVTTDDFEYGNVIRMGGLVYTSIGSSSFVDPDWSPVSSRGMAWGWGTIINRVGGEDQVRYDSWHTQGEYPSTDYSATGVWDSTSTHDRPEGQTAASSLEVYADESYYYSCCGFTDSQHGANIILTITTKNELRTSSAVILSSSSASSGVGTTHTYSKMTIPKPQVDNQRIMLNLCSKTLDSSRYPSTRAQLNMQLWRTRKTEFDEYVTLYGIADGKNRWYLDSEKYTENGKEKSRTVLRIPKRVKQLMIGTPDAEKWFVYPKDKDKASWAEVSYASSSDFPNIGIAETYYIARDTGYVSYYDSTLPNWVSISPLVMRAYKVNSYGVEDPVSIAKYGRIEKILNFSNCSDPETLKQLGAKKMFEAKLEGLELNVTALDLSLLENNVDSPDVLDMIAIRSLPHKIGKIDPTEQDFSLPLSSRDIPLSDPSQQQYSIGYSGARKITKTYDWVKK